MKSRYRSAAIRSLWVATASLCIAPAFATMPLVESSIDDIQDAIRAGKTTCKEVVEGFVARAKAYNGICTKLVTENGQKIVKVPGTMRNGSPLAFPVETLAVSKLVPDYAKYTGPKPDFGRMEPTMSDPSVYQQFGQVVGIPNARQVNALATLNIRGERSVTCKGKFDAHPSTGPLPA